MLIGWLWGLNAFCILVMVEQVYLLKCEKCEMLCGDEMASCLNQFQLLSDHDLVATYIMFFYVIYNYILSIKYRVCTQKKFSGDCYSLVL